MWSLGYDPNGDLTLFSVPSTVNPPVPSGTSLGGLPLSASGIVGHRWPNDTSGHPTHSFDASTCFWNYDFGGGALADPLHAINTLALHAAGGPITMIFTETRDMYDSAGGYHHAGDV